MDFELIIYCDKCNGRINERETAICGDCYAKLESLLDELKSLHEDLRNQISDLENQLTKLEKEV